MSHNHDEQERNEDVVGFQRARPFGTPHWSVVFRTSCHAILPPRKDPSRVKVKRWIKQETPYYLRFPWKCRAKLNKRWRSKKA